MAVQIANPLVARKIEAMAQLMGVGKTAVIEIAIDRLGREKGHNKDVEARMRALLTQIDLIPDRDDAFDATPWDAHGLPR